MKILNSYFNGHWSGKIKHILYGEINEITKNKIFIWLNILLSFKSIKKGLKDKIESLQAKYKIVLNVNTLLSTCSCQGTIKYKNAPTCIFYLSKTEYYSIFTG
jgi:hypothetical protein